MEINNNSVNSQREILQEKKTSEVKPTILAKESAVDVAYPDLQSMKAYANINSVNRTVSKQEVLEFIHSTGCQFEQRCEEFIKRLTDSDGYIKQETFDFIKNNFNKKTNLFILTSLIENSKENGRINHKMLEVAEPALSELKSASSYTIADSGNIPKFFKDKNGKFNSDMLDIICEDIKDRPKRLLTRPDYLAHYYFTKDREFDIDAINYFKEQKTQNREIKDIQTEILAGKDKNGKFLLEKLNVYKELKPHLEQWQINRAQELIDKVEDKKSFIELAKTMKEDEKLSSIFDIIEEVSSSETNKTNLSYDKKSVEFVRDLIKNSYGNNGKVAQILKTINLPIEEYNEENINLVKNMLRKVTKPEDYEPLLNAAIYKTGNKKGQFSFENLNRYIDIYKTNFDNINEVKYISGTLSMETDDAALDTIHRLYNLEWHEEGRYSERIKRLDRGYLHTIFDLSTHGHEGVPKKSFHTPVLENFNKLMSMHLPMTSAEAFQNFMLFPEIDIVEKLEKVRLDEVGLNTGQLTNSRFKNASEEELFSFKNYLLDYLKDKNNKYIDVNLNSNLKDVIEIKNDIYGNESSKVMYNMTKKRPEAEMTIKQGLNHVEKIQKDFDKNSVVKQIFRNKKLGKYEPSYEQLISQTYKQYDKDWNLQFTEQIDESEIENVFNVKRIYPDGRVEDLVKAQKLSDGNILVEKNLTSANGTKTFYRYEDDVNGNRIMDYKIVDKDGNVLMNQSSSFEVINENHFVSSRNNKKFDVKFEGNLLHVKDLQTGKLAEINLVNFTNSTQNDIVPLLKKIPGDELFEMKEFNLKSLSLDNSMTNAAFSPKKELIGISDKYLDEGVLLHEWGHGKDELAFKEIKEKIANDDVIKATYEKERINVRKIFPEAILDHFSYFGADYHYLGSEKIKEPIAEANLILDVLPRHFVNSIRTHYLMQDFPEFIAKASKLLH